jgi:hypothetical protein
LLQFSYVDLTSTYLHISTCICTEQTKTIVLKIAAFLNTSELCLKHLEMNSKWLDQCQKLYIYIYLFMVAMVIIEEVGTYIFDDDQIIGE